MLTRESVENIIAELSAHLEDGYQDGLSRGLDESEASKRVRSGIQWIELAREIRRTTLKEESMNNRTKSLWLPMAVNLAVAAALLEIPEKLGVQPRIVHISHMDVAFHLPWLCTLPVSAVAASLLAKRAKAPSTVRLIAGLALSLISLAVFRVMALVFKIDRWEFPSGFPLPLDYFALSAVCWIFLPAPAPAGHIAILKEIGHSRGLDTNTDAQPCMIGDKQFVSVSSRTDCLKRTARKSSQSWPLTLKRTTTMLAHAA
jgi:hypothetical protein